MNRIKVECEVRDYTETTQNKVVKVTSDWCKSDHVHVVIDGHSCEVVGEDLIAAIRNCMNTR